MTTWDDELRALFAQICEPFSVVLQARGCREGWLQGEAFRFLRARGHAAYVNYVTLPSPNGMKNLKADLAVYANEGEDADLELVSEFKVYGERGYYNKNLTGGSLSEIQRRLAKRSPVVFADRQDDRQLVVDHGLLADYFRLIDYVADPMPLRVLLLCVQKHEEPDVFGQVLRQIEFEQPGQVVADTATLWAKAWTVGGDTR